MTNIWLETFLGKIGKYIASFMSEYLYYIIPVVLAYGIFLAISSYNLKRIEKKADVGIIKKAKDILKKNPSMSNMELVDQIAIPWKKIIKENSFFPYVSRQSDLWVSKTNISNVKGMVMHDGRRIRLVLKRKGIVNFKENSGAKKNLYMERTQRLTRGGED